LGDATIDSSTISSPTEKEEILQLAAEKEIKPRVELRPLKKANQTIQDMEAGNARYRYILGNEEHI
jgi:D-arabinose 1-dehydrogenase-like Zn-dependent alcohol dehydrogenase